MTQTIFISHAYESTDSEKEHHKKWLYNFVEKLQKETNFKIIIDYFDLGFVENNIVDFMEGSIKNCNACIVIFTKTYLEKISRGEGNAHREYNALTGKDIGNTNFKFYPILIGVNWKNLPELHKYKIAFKLADNFTCEINNDEYIKLLNAIKNKKFEIPTNYHFEKQHIKSYLNYLQSLYHSQIFNENLSLKDIYVNPKIAIHSSEFYNIQHIIDIDDFLEYCKQIDRLYPVTLILGLPGYGKSSFLKYLVYNLVDNFEEIPVLLIPIRDIDARCIEQFSKDNSYENFKKVLLSGLIKNKIQLLFGGSTENLQVKPYIEIKPSPMALTNQNDKNIEKLLEFILSKKSLIMLDGLDEISGSMTGNDNNFTRNFFKQLQASNLEGHKLIITSRNLVFDKTILDNFIDNKCIYEILPYTLTEKEKENIQKKTSSSSLDLTFDIRSLWWKKFGIHLEKQFPSLPKLIEETNYTNFPAKLLESITSSENIEITQQPLMNLLIALAIKNKTLNLSNNHFTKNDIYENILKYTFNKNYDTFENKKNKSVGTHRISFDEFLFFMQKIAIIFWQQNELILKLKKLKEEVQELPLIEDEKEKLNIFLSEENLQNILIQFYFKPNCIESNFNKLQFEAIEYTHKTYREYLTAKAMVTSFMQMIDELKNAGKINIIQDFKPLKHWIATFGNGAFTIEILDFIKNELQKNIPKNEFLFRTSLSFLSNLFSYYSM